MVGIVAYFVTLSTGPKWLQIITIALTAIVGGRSIFLLVKMGFEDEERARQYKALNEQALNEQALKNAIEPIVAVFRDECEVPVHGDGVSYELKGTNNLPSAKD